MTRSERERLIVRHLSGEMGPTEERDFFLQVALDKELRQELQAQRTIDSAFKKEREGEPTQHTALRMRIQDVLAASPARAPQTEETERRRTWISRPGRWFSAGLVLIALLTTALLLSPSGTPPREQNAPATSVPAVSAPAGSDPATLRPRDRQPGETATSGESSTAVSSDATGAAATPESRPTQARQPNGAEQTVSGAASPSNGTIDAAEPRASTAPSAHSPATSRDDAGAISSSGSTSPQETDTTKPTQSSKDPLNVGVRIRFPEKK